MRVLSDFIHVARKVWERRSSNGEESGRVFVALNAVSGINLRKDKYSLKASLSTEMQMPKETLSFNGGKSRTYH